jgi:hypothetical protein
MRVVELKMEKKKFQDEERNSIYFKDSSRTTQMLLRNFLPPISE